jgi:branched-chain amino acid transport system permease protein
MDSLLAADGLRADRGSRAQRLWKRVLAQPLLLAAGLVALPLLTSDFLAYQVALFLIYGIATQGVALCWGRLGFLPLGQALFFGLGAYLAGGALKGAESDRLWLAALPLALLVPMALAYIVAALVFSRSLRSGPYFSLITLAMTMLGFLGAQQWSSVTGGFNGMSGIPDLPGLERYSSLYWLVAACAVASTAMLGVLLRRPIGVVWSAIAQNEDRLQLLGYPTDRIKAGAYALSAGLAAGAGGLFALHQGIVTPTAMGFVLATEFVIWAAVGGKASPVGALLGAVLVGYASAELRDQFSYWEVLVALLFILVVRFMPQGVAGLAQRLLAGRRPAPAGERAAGELPAPQPSRHAAGALALELREVGAEQGGVRILDKLSLNLEGPGIRCVIGPNGAGKTSTFNVITGRLPAPAGRIHFGGHDITGQAAWRVAQAGIGRKLQIPSVFAELTVRQNLDLALWAGRLHGTAWLRRDPMRWKGALQERMLDRFPELREQFPAAAGTLSQGQRQALEFVMTVLPQPRLLLLDEPCAGLSSAETHRMTDAIRDAVAQLGAAALLIEHDMSAVEAIGGHVFVLHQGRLLSEGSLEQVQADPAVRAVYAGGHK